MESQNFRKQTNNTAKTTLLHLAAAGDPDAREFAREMGINQAGMFRNEQQHNAMAAGNLVMLEARYASMNHFIESCDAGTIIDLPCGYTPRALRAKLANKHYIGCDLPAVIDEIGPVVRKLIQAHGSHVFVEHRAVDATNYDSLRSALENVRGEICIATEGLMMYLTDPELRLLCANMRRILVEFGGCWLTPDPEVMIQTPGVLRAMMGPESMANLHASGHTYSQKPNAGLGKNSLIVRPMEAGSIDRAMGFMHECGLKVKRIPMAEGLSDLRCFANLLPEQREGVMRVYRCTNLWKITPEETAIESVIGQGSTPFALRANVVNDKLAFALCGRLDSITAPKLLETYEKFAGSANGDVEMDCRDLQYVSSAGLRVLMLMVKQGRKVRMLGMSDMLRALFEQTGFDQILKLV